MENNSLKILLYLFLLSLVACHPSVPVKQELKMANAVIEENPDTALYILNRISSVETLEEEDYATYCLLTTQAEEMKGILHTSDQRVKDALSYFRNHSNQTLRAKCFYYAARVYADLENYELAEQYFISVLELLESMHKYSSAGFVYDRLSQLYLRLGEPQKALDAQRNSYHNYLLAEKQNKNSTWHISLIIIFLIISLMGLIVRYNLGSKKKEKQIGKQERQLNAAKSTIQEQKTELLLLSKELKSMKFSLYNSSEIVKKIRDINSLTIATKDKSVLSEGEWNSFLNLLEETYGFISKLKNHYPRLTDIDIRICALVKENITNYHMSSILNMTPETLTKRMQRMKSDKMNQSGQNVSLKAIINNM